MTSFTELMTLVENNEMVQFWTEIATKDNRFITSLISETPLESNLADKITYLRNLEHFRFGIAPNLDDVQELIQHFAFQNFDINIFNLEDFIFQWIETENKVNVNEKSLRELVFKKLSMYHHEASLLTFIDVILVRTRIHLFDIAIILSKDRNFTVEIITKILAQTIEQLGAYFLSLHDPESEYLLRFLNLGFVFAKIDNKLMIFYGNPGRREHLKNTVFGCPVSISFRDLGADIIVEHGDGSLTEFAFEEEAVTHLTLRASDKVRFTFSNDVGFRNIESIEMLSLIPCNVEIDFKKPKKGIESEVQFDSNRQRSRTERLNKILNQILDLISLKITVLDFSNVSQSVDSETIEMISQAENLISLILNNAGISSNDISKLQNLRKLRTLDISGINVDSDGEEFLKDFPVLHKLVCKNTPTIIEMLDRSSHLPRITGLDLSENSLNKNSINFLPQLNYLKTLTIENTDFSEIEFSFMRKFPKLSELKLRNSKFSPYSLQSLCECIEELSFLNISVDKPDMTLSGSDFEQLSRIENIENLSISNRMLQDDFLLNLVLNSPKIKKLDVSFSILTNLGLSHIAKYKHLVELNISGCHRIDDNGAIILCNSQLKLQKLDIRGTGITNIGLIKLSERFPKLQFNRYIS